MRKFVGGGEKMRRAAVFMVVPEWSGDFTGFWI